MSNFMNFLYEHYIKAHIDAQPKDDGDELRFGLLECSMEKSQEEDIEAVLGFTAVHAFLFGMQAGREVAPPAAVTEGASGQAGISSHSACTSTSPPESSLSPLRGQLPPGGSHSA